MHQPWRLFSYARLLTRSVQRHSSDAYFWAAHSFCRQMRIRLIRHLGNSAAVMPLLGLGLWKAKDTVEKKDDKLIKFDSLYNHYLIDLLYSELLPYRECLDDELLWRLARVTCEKAKLTKDKTERKKLMFEAYAYIERALNSANGADNFAVHKWTGILLNYTGEYEGTKESIKRSEKIKDHFMKAVELNPMDATTWNLLGVWCFTFADLPWYQRQIATAIFGRPPTSSYQEALSHFLKAESISPNFYSKNLLMIGKTYLRLDEKEKAKEYFQRTVDYVVQSSDDREAHDEASKLLQ